VITLEGFVKQKSLFVKQMESAFISRKCIKQPVFKEVGIKLSQKSGIIPIILARFAPFKNGFSIMK